MKKLSKKEVVKLLKKNKFSYKELSNLTGYHEKSLVRLNSQIKNNTINVTHGNKNKKPYNYVDESTKEELVIKFKEKNYRSYKEFYNCLNNEFSYSFISKLLSSKSIYPKKTYNKLIKRKMIDDNIIQYRNIRYKIINGDIKHHENVLLSKKPLYVIYNDVKYDIKPFKKVESRKGLTKYY